jgi:hypothetical protein
MVVPGTYTATLGVNGQTLARTITVKPDPRARWTQADYVARHAFLAGLYAEVDQIDAALNRLDVVRGTLARRINLLESTHAPAAQLQSAKMLAHQAQIVYAELTSNPRNSEDNQWRADKLRERILILIDVYDLLSQGPPSQAHKREAAEIRPIYDTAMSHYRRFISSLGGG